MKAKVYFSRTITPEMVVALCEKTGKKLPGKVAVKLHTGEVGNQNFIKPVFWKPAVEMVHGTVVECNTAYGGERDTTEQHIRTLEKHGWTKMFTVDLLDAEGPDMELSIPNGKRIKKNFVGKDLANYDSMLVLTHFKGHVMGGFGGSLKNIAIGCASGKTGKAQLHSDGTNLWAGGPLFMERMVEGGKAITTHFKGHMAYINVLRRMSVDCDCAGTSAAEPTAPDIGILASTDLLAVDQASVDMVYALPEQQRHDLVERIESRSGLRQLEYMETLGMGHARYDLVSLS